MSSAQRFLTRRSNQSNKKNGGGTREDFRDLRERCLKGKKMKGLKKTTFRKRPGPLTDVWISAMGTDEDNGSGSNFDLSPKRTGRNEGAWGEPGSLKSGCEFPPNGRKCSRRSYPVDWRERCTGRRTDSSILHEGNWLEPYTWQNRARKEKGWTACSWARPHATYEAGAAKGGGPMRHFSL